VCWQVSHWLVLLYSFDADKEEHGDDDDVVDEGNPHYPYE